MTPTAANESKSRNLVEQLKRSQIYSDYQKAFRATTGLPLALSSPGAFGLPCATDPNENGLCKLMGASNHSCSACLQHQKTLDESAKEAACSIRCFAGLFDSAVPIKVGNEVVAYLKTGQVLRQMPTQASFSKVSRRLVDFGADIDLQKAEEAYFKSRIVSQKQYESIVKLLSIFAEHLSTVSNQLLVQGEGVELPSIVRAKAFIEDQYAEELSLDRVAKAVNMSSFYFCKVFRKVTGMTFTEYLARIRIEQVKTLLLEPHARISEAAFAVGFQSLSQFNRVFRRIAGESPSTYRDRVRAT